MNRIPIQKSDYPKSFNKVAKYFGRHWPLGELALGQSRETAAVLLGYSNTYSLEREFVPSIETRISKDEAVKLITAKAVKHYGVKVSDIYDIANKAPLHELSAFAEKKNQNVFSSALQAIVGAVQSRERDPNYFLFLDEAGTFPNPLFDKNVLQRNRGDLHSIDIPQFSYAVYADGSVFYMDIFANLIDMIDKEYLTDSELVGNLLKQATMPLDQYLIDTEKNTFRFPKWIENNGEQTKDGMAVSYVHHKGLNANYPVVFDFLGLRDIESEESIRLSGVLRQIYMNETVGSDGNEITKEAVSTFVYRGQTFWRKADYFKAEVPKWIDGFVDAPKNPSYGDVDYTSTRLATAVIDSIEVENIIYWREQFDRLFVYPRFQERHEAFDHEALRVFFHSLYDPKSKKCNPVYELYGDYDDGWEKRLGDAIRHNYPSLSDYGSEWLGEMFDSYYDDHRHMNVRQYELDEVNGLDCGFYAYLLMEAVGNANDELIALLIIEKIGTGTPLSMDRIVELFFWVSKVRSLYREVEEVTWFLKEDATDVSPFKTVGETLLRYNLSFSETFSSMRKFGSSVVTAAQSLEDLTTKD